MDRETLQSVERAIGYCFKDLGLLDRALRHASVADSRVNSNERMEFLGDAVLGLVVSEHVYRRFPELLEGEMTKIKSAAVSRQTCAAIAQRLGLDASLLLGKGLRSQGELPMSLSAAVLEAVIAAIYLDGGYTAAQAFLGPLIDPLIGRAADGGHQENFKSVLQHHVQQHFQATPIYRVLDEKGPDHAKCFKVTVEFAGQRFEAAWGQSKKRAEQLAAFNALKEMGLVYEHALGEIRVAPNGTASGAAGFDRPQGEWAK